MTPDTKKPIPWRVMAWASIPTLLLVPLVAMQFTDEVVWDLTDFVVAAMLLGGVGLGIELAARLSTQHAYRAGAIVVIVGGLVLVWVNLAVGIVGSENDPANLLYGTVLMVGAIVAARGRFRPKQMVRATLAMAVAQVGVAIAHLIAGHFTPIVTGAFVALWLMAAALFRTADKVVGRPTSLGA